MKKFFFLFVILFNIIMFYSFIDVYKEKDIYDITSVFQVMKDGFVQSVTFQTDIYEKRDSFIHDLKTYADNYEITVVKQSIDIEENSYIEYIYTNDNLSSISNIAVKEDVDFSSLSTQEFYSNYQSQGYPLFLLNHEILVDVKPFTDLLESRYCIGTYDFYAHNQQQLNQFIEVLEDNYSQDIQEFNEFHRESYDNTFTLNEEMQTLMFFSLILFATFLGIWISKNSYKNSIYYLNGYSTIEIYSELYGKAFLWGVCISVISIIVLFMLRIQQINQRTIPFVFDCLLYTGLQWIGILIIFFIYLFIQKCQHKAILLKKNNMNKILLHCQFFIKLLSIIILVPSLTSHCLSVVYHINNYQYMKKQYEGIENYQHIHGMKFEYQDSRYMEYYEGKTNEVVQLYQKSYDILEDNGAVYYSEEPLFYTQGKLIRINKQYLALFPITDINQKPIQLDNDLKKSYLLVPESLYDSISVDDFKLSDNDVIEKIMISNQQEYLRHLDYQYDENTKHELTCLFIDSLHLEKKPYGKIYIPLKEEQINDLLKGTIFENTLLMKSLGESLNQESLLLPSLILNDIEIAVCFILFIAGLVIEYFYLYYNVYCKDFAVKKMYGYSFIELTYPIYVENICVYGLGLLYFIIKGFQPLYFVVLLFLFDMLIQYSIYRWLYKKKVSQLLKEVS